MHNFTRSISKALSAMLLVLAMAVEAGAASDNFTQYVNPMIGAGGHGHVFVGANVPFGLVQLGPTEFSKGWDWCSGYHYSDDHLIGFSHTHLSGTGCTDLCDVTLMPMLAPDTALRSVRFSHADETVKPGYYSVQLRNPNVKVELSASERTGIHRYTFAPGTSEAYLLIDTRNGIGGYETVHDCDFLPILGKGETKTRHLQGFRYMSGFGDNRYMFFDMELSQPVTVVSQPQKGIAIVKLDDPSQPLVVKVGLSGVSCDNARDNARAEMPGWNLDEVAAQADAKWNMELGRVKATSSDPTVMRIFYTAMYHSMVAPSIFSDVNGDYRGADACVHHAATANYGTFSLWDTYRAQHPLMTLIHTDKLNDIAHTFVNIFREQGKLPIWHLLGCETNCMVGSSAVPVLGDLVLKGFVDDKGAAYEAMKQSMLYNDRLLPLLKQYGYIPYDKADESETVAKALEYCIDDDAVARVARKLGKTDDYNYFFKRSRSYAKYFDRSTGFMRAIGTDGKFRTPFDAFAIPEGDKDYTEGNAWQYIWLVPHDVHGLVSLFPSEKAFTAKLDSLFVVEGDVKSEIPDVTGLIGQYAHGNEPSHHIIYLYNYVGQPYKAAPLLRKVMNEMYKDDVNDGLCGNEDVGQMSAWYILSAMGLYQVEPAGGKYVFGSPVLDSATLTVKDGRQFTITALNNSTRNIYIQSVKLNGKKYDKSYITFGDIARGGTLEFVMGPKPSKFGTSKNSRP